MRFLGINVTGFCRQRSDSITYIRLVESDR